ncbi:MAG TPA: hypothetical protein VJZ01_05485 [Lachnospiraceae bacterium]|nr:hypothetical protein [Lachnospiraceae bacterium]
MGLFSKKPPCPICGGKIPLILPSKIEGEYICNDQNQILKGQFVVSERIDFGFWDTKKYKALMEDGVISRQEFDAKKRQLLGI